MAMMVVGNADLKAVQWLIDDARGQGMVVSCYADTSVAGGITPLWREHLDREVQLAARSLASAEARQELQRNVAVVRSILASGPARQARGMAVFSSVQRGLARGFAFGTPLTNRLVVDENLYILPLLELLHRQRRYLVVHTDTHHGRLYSVARGTVLMIAEIEEDVPKRQRSAGECWGKQQATIARHREDHIRHYRKELLGEIERAWPEERYAGIVLLGAHEVLEHVRKELPAYLAREVVHEGPHAWVGRQPRIEARLQEIVADAARAHDRRLADDVQTRRREHHGVAAGPQEVIDAIRNSQVNHPGYVVMEPDRGEAGWLCAACGSLFAHAHDTCPFCGARCTRSNLWQEIALLATRHGIALHFVGSEAGLQPLGGVAAVLSRDEPWTPAPARTPQGASVPSRSGG